MARETYKQGKGKFQVKLGADRDWQAGVARLTRLREVVGDGPLVYGDWNCCTDALTAIRVARARAMETRTGLPMRRAARLRRLERLHRCAHRHSCGARTDHENEDRLAHATATGKRMRFLLTRLLRNALRLAIYAPRACLMRLSS